MPQKSAIEFCPAVLILLRTSRGRQPHLRRCKNEQTRTVLVRPRRRRGRPSPRFCRPRTIRVPAAVAPRPSLHGSITAGTSGTSRRRRRARRRRPTRPTTSSTSRSSYSTSSSTTTTPTGRRRKATPTKTRTRTTRARPRTRTPRTPRTRTRSRTARAAFSLRFFYIVIFTAWTLGIWDVGRRGDFVLEQKYSCRSSVNTLISRLVEPLVALPGCQEGQPPLTYSCTTLARGLSPLTAQESK